MSLRQEKLEELFERPVKDDGENFILRCPVKNHRDKTPSFSIHKDKLIINCFGCRTKGTLLNFVKDYKGVDEKGALKLLGLSLEDMISMEFDGITSPEQPKVYPISWLAPFTEGVHKYVISRGFTKDTIQAAGARYDNSTKRQVFPHYNRKGELVGAVGRSCNNQEPRWYFYWGYPKGRYLYRAPEVGTIRPVWVVEGVFDALWLYQHGYTAVATLGTKITEYQIQEIKDSYKSVIIALDNDASGEEAGVHLYKKLHDCCNIYFPFWPEEANDIMDVDPTKIDLLNVIERTLVFNDT